MKASAKICRTTQFCRFKSAQICRSPHSNLYNYANYMHIGTYPEESMQLHSHLIVQTSGLYSSANFLVELIHGYLIQWNLKSDHLKSGLFEGQISNGRVLALAIVIVPTMQKTDCWKSRQFLSRFLMVSDKMADFCPDFKWSSSGISDPISKSSPFATQSLLDHSKSRSLLYLIKDACFF